MTLDQTFPESSDCCLIARHRLAAGQWEAVLAGDAGFRTRQAWLRPPLFGLGDWLERRWEQARLAGSAEHDRCLLSAGQSRRLWRQVINDSPEGAELIHSAGVADWAASARRGLLEQGIAPGPRLWQGSRAETVFLRWHRTFERRLAREGWIDPDSLLHALNRRADPAPVGSLCLLDPPAALPAELERLIAQRRDRGQSTAIEWPAACRAERRALVAATPETELGMAADWAAGRLERNDRLRIAVVVPDLDSRTAEVEQIFAAAVGADRVGSAGGQTAGDIAMLGAAVSTLRLLSPRCDFGTLSRWLRSPFFTSADRNRAGQAAGFERWLRADPRSQQEFVLAWRELGLKSELARRLPDAAARIDAVLGRLPRRAAPTAWVAFWQASLASLGWLGAGATAADPWRDPWERALAGFAALTPITGPLDGPAALDELEAVLADQRLVAPLPLHGVHLLRRIADIGPGFSAAWITGFSEQRWPEPAMPNPLLPWRLQQAHRLPGADPKTVLVAAGTELERLLTRVPELVFSCPERLLDQPQVPNPRFDDWVEASAGPAPARNAAGFAAGRVGARDRETVADPAPPLIGTQVPGGARTLDLQSACPVRAFAAIRLGAEPLETPLRGIDARLRGMLMHRVLELVYRRDLGADATHRPSTQADRTALQADRTALLADAIRAAMAELTPAGDAAWQALLAAERGRIERLVLALLELEHGRPAFTTIAVERRATIELAGHELRCRIDRIDSLAAGGELLLDYKTGSVSGTSWFDDRIGDCQLPLYAQLGGPATAGIALVVLNEQGASYRAAGPAADGLPGRQTVIEPAAWAGILTGWREQLETLVSEFVAGDVRIRRDRLDLAAGAFGALTRVRSLPE